MSHNDLDQMPRRFANLQNEFPDFPIETLPKIPSFWIDESWHNDTCPSFRTETGLRVFIDYADKAMREIQDWPRYNVQCDGGDMETDTPESLIATDDWNAVIAAIAEHEKEIQRRCQHRNDGRDRCIDCGAFL